MVTVDIKPVNNVKEIAEEIGMSYERFLAGCIVRGLHTDTARAIWNKEERKRGYYKTTQSVVAKVLHREVGEVFPAREAEEREAA